MKVTHFDFRAVYSVIGKSEEEANKEVNQLLEKIDELTNLKFTIMKVNHIDTKKWLNKMEE